MAIYSTSVLQGVKSFTLPFGQAQTGGYIDTIRVANTYDSTFLVDEIVFTAWNNNADNNDTDAVLANSSLLDNFAFQFAVGNILFSDYAIPTSLYCTELDGGNSQNPNYSGGADANSLAVNLFQRSTRRWIPPAPILLKPHWTLACMVNQFVGPILPTPPVAQAGYSATFNVNIALIGRVTDDTLPATAPYPYILSYFPSSPVTNEYTDFRSFYNPLSKPLRIQRLIGRQYIRKPGSETGTLLSNLYYHDSLRQLPDIMNVLLTDSYGYSLVDTTGQPGAIAQAAPMGMVFDIANNAFTFNRNLGPQDYYKAQFIKSSATAYSTYDVYPWVSAIGTRDEPV